MKMRHFAAKASSSNTRKEKRNEEYEARIPPTSTPVKVTNVIDPYHLRIYETEKYSERLRQLEGKLHQLAKKKLRNYGDESEPQIGDLVLVDNRNSFNVDLPAWYCRGVVGSGKTAESKYIVFLPDHGIALEFWMEELKIPPPDSISNVYLTSSIGINDILPITLSQNAVACISEQWSRGAVRFTREMIRASTHTYFDHLTSDKSGNKFGELYLILDGEIVALSKALVCNQFAIVINDGLMGMIDNPDTPIALQASIDTAGNTHNGHNSTGEHYGNTEDRENSDKSDDDRGRDRSTAVYARAFNESLKKNCLANPDQEIIIFSKDRCEQLNSVTEARFPAQIHKVLRSKSIQRPMRLQGYAWPAIINGLNVVAVAAQKSGKTLSYLVPVISLIAANKTYAKVPDVYGPLALILCVSSSDVHAVHAECKELLRHYPRVKVLPAYNGISQKSIVAKVYNGCEILISTPLYLTRLIKSDRKLLNFSRLSHMVFDGADVILDEYQKSLGEILKIPNVAENGRRESPLQMIAIARHWTRSLKRFVMGFIENPYVCIGSYMEAAVYAAIKSKLIFLPKNKKAAKVVELLDVGWSMIKTVIVCTMKKEAMELVEVLKSSSIDTLLVHDETIMTEIRGVKETWTTRVSGKYFVLVCTDQVLSDLNIKDAECLIHYSLNCNTKTQFFYRFSTLSNNFTSRVREKGRPKPNFILMADESNDAQLNGVVQVMLRLEAKIPPMMDAYLKKIFISVEMAKTDRILCENIKAFGRCPRRDSCASRHLFVPEIDQPTTAIRTGDWVKLVLTGRHRHSANHYSARVIEYTTSLNEQVPFSFEEFTALPVKMQKHYANPANRRSSKTVKVGHVCAIEEAPGNYKRVQVLVVKDDKDLVNMQYVKVRCVDDGDLFSIKACELLEIPDDLAKWPSHIVDIYMTGIVPFDNEPVWSPCTEDIVRNWFDENLVYPTSYVCGKVVLHLGHVLWVDPLEVRHKLDGYPDLVDSSLKSTLIEEKCAAENKEHIANLIDICRISSIATDLFPDYIAPGNGENIVIEQISS